MYYETLMRVAKNVVEARRQLLADLLQNGRYLALDRICQELSISPATARRDLVELERSGRVKRTPGGAMTRFTDRFPTFHDRLNVQAPAKQALARQVLPYLRSGFTVYIDGGTTPYALARLLPEADIPGLKVVTNSLPVVDFLSSTSVDLHVLGGSLVPRQSLLLGAEAVHSLRDRKFDVAILGAEGLTQAGVWNSAPKVVELQRAVIRQSRQSFILLTSDKLGKQAASLLAPLGEPLRLITDASAKQMEAQQIPVSMLQERNR